MTRQEDRARLAGEQAGAVRQAQKDQERMQVANHEAYETGYEDGKAEGARVATPEHASSFWLGVLLGGLVSAVGVSLVWIFI